MFPNSFPNTCYEQKKTNKHDYVNKKSIHLSNFFRTFGLSFNNYLYSIMKSKLSLMLIAMVAVLAYSCGAPKKAKCDAYSAKDVHTSELASK